MAIANTELMLNKPKWHALETIRKVSCAASQQLRGGFNVFAKSQLRSAHWLHKEHVTSSPYPTLNCRRLLIKVLYSHETSGWDLGEKGKKKKKSFSTAFKPGCVLSQPFLQQMRGCSRSYSALESTPLLPGGFGAASAPATVPPKRSRVPELCICRVFRPVPCLLLEYLEPKWRTAASLAAACPKRHHASVATRFWNTVLNNNLSGCNFCFRCLVLLRPLIRQTRAVSWR